MDQTNSESIVDDLRVRVAALEKGLEMVTRLSAQHLTALAAATEPFIDEYGTTWNVPTAFSYAQACKALNGKTTKLAAAEADTKTLWHLARCPIDVTDCKDCQAAEETIKRLAAIDAAQSEVKPCLACNGNDSDRPCAYPSDGMTGCLRDKRLKAARGEKP